LKAIGVASDGVASTRANDSDKDVSRILKQQYLSLLAKWEKTPSLMNKVVKRHNNHPLMSLNSFTQDYQVFC
jgi:hypothetical protein